ncbi:MAG: ketol-acid reductoisomerase [Candidatus Bathyarchaeia archaeon]
MEAKVYYDKDVTTTHLKNKTIAIIGYGIQGRAQALNLRDSGYNVVIGLRSEGPSSQIAAQDGFQIHDIAEAARQADVIHLLIPDMEQAKVYRAYIQPHLTEGKALGVAHGFTVHFKEVVPPKNVDVFMVAPKSPGKRVREIYQQGFGTPALVAVYQNYTGKALDIALEMAKGMGCTRAGALPTNFKDETESDLIGEQAVLVGGLMELIKKGFEVLLEEGYPPELAYYEACNEAKLIMDLIYERGITGMLHGVSVTARYGGLTMGPKIIDDHVKENMRKAAKEVKNGNFAKAWIQEYEKGMPVFNKLLKEMQEHPIEKAGKFIRKSSGLEK